MRIKASKFSDELKFQVVQEYLTTGISQRELMDRYSIQGPNTIRKWMRIFDLTVPSQKQLELQRTMAKQKEKTPHELELEAKVKSLEKQLDHEQLRNLALNTMIDIIERDYKIPVRKKPGSKQ